MRLTLRTLLAYLDDVLPPSETKALGERIKQTPAAAELVDRVRDVVRRRRLSAPDVQAEGLNDANVTAEYLDNCLDASAVSELERIALSSDETLAEIAACHQVLTLVVGEPVDVPTRLRERVYGIGAIAGMGAPAAPSRSVRDATAREQLSAIRAADAPKSVAPPTSSVEDRLPEYLRQPPFWKRTLPWLLVAACLIGWLGLFYVDGSFSLGRFSDQEVAQQEAAKNAAAVPAMPIPAKGQVSPAKRDVPSVAKDSVATTESADGVAGSQTQNGATLSVDPEPPADDVPISPEISLPMISEKESMAAPTELSGEGIAMTASPPLIAVETPVETPPGATPAASLAENGTDVPNLDVPENVQIHLLSANGPLLRRDPQTGEWWTVVPTLDPPSGVEVAIPEPFETTFSLTGVLPEITMLGGSKVRPFGKTAAASAGVAIDQGRLRFTGPEGGGQTAGPLQVAVQLGSTLWRLELLTPESHAALEVVPRQPNAVGQDLSAAAPLATLYVVGGSVRLSDSSGQVTVYKAGERSNFGEEKQPSEQATAVAAAAPPSEATPGVEGATSPEPTTAVPLSFGGGFPAWINAQPVTTAGKLAMTTFEEEFQAEVPVGVSLLPAVRDRRYYISELAVKCLAVVEHIQGLVKALKDSEHEEAVIAAIDGLRVWMAQQPDSQAILMDELTTVFPAATAEIITRLLWGYSESDARDRQTAMQLVEWLDHPEFAVRELADYQVVRLGGRRMNYRPTLPAGQRGVAVRRWKDFVSQHGGLLLPE